MDDLSGQIVKSYQIINEINVGGFGAVYRAFQPVIEREVALKVILPRYASQPEFIRRFEVEAQTVAQLEHPFIVPMYDYWRDPDGAYLVMRLMRGGSLRDIAQDGALPVETVLGYIDQIASALGLAHRQNIIHRDIKPENILLDEDNNAFLTDFGIAQRHDLDMDSDDLDSFAGSINYIAPELIRGQRPYITADIYSLGIMTFELLAGHLPFEGAVAPTMLHHHLSTILPDIQDTAEQIPDSINQVLQRACSKDPEDRYPTVRDFARALRDATTLDTKEIFVTSEMFKIRDNPYKGLRPFNEADAQDFFGREDLITTLVKRLNEDHVAANFLAVVGPSGSGKSSVVRAGLIPRMRFGDVADSTDWFIADMIPDADPIGNLANALLGLASQPLPNLLERLQTDENAILWAAEQILSDASDGQLLLFIDQFEEVFTLVDDEAVRTHFLKLLSRTIKKAGHIYIIVTIRADFFDKPLLYDGIGDLIQSRTQVVLPLTAQEIERAITGPAENANLIVDSELIAAIVADVRQEPGALPLLQYTLTELFERRITNNMTLDTYIDSGGVLSSLARRAQDVYDDLLVSQRALTPQIFLRLVTLGEGTEDTRRRARRAELLDIGADRDEINTILNTFGQYRLLTFDRDATTHEPTVEIAHEALIKRWDDLRAWIVESRDDVRLQRSLASAAKEWRDNQQQVGYLLHGARLLQYQEWLDETTIGVNEQERAYLDASIAEKERRDAEERARQNREAQLQQRVLNRTRFLAFFMAIAIIITMSLALVAVNQRRTAQTESANALSARATSEANAIQAQQRAEEIQNFNLVNIAQQSIRTGDSSLAVALLQSVAQNPNLAPAIQSEIYPAAYSTQLRAQLAGHTDKVTAVAISEDGRYIATGSEDLRIILWDANTQAIITEFSGHQGIVSGLAFSPDSMQLVSVGNDALVIVWDIASGTPLLQLRGHRNVITDVAYSPTGEQFATSSGDDTVIIWDAITGEIIHQLTGHLDSVRSVAYAPNGNQLVSASRDETLMLWDIATGTLIRTYTGHSGSVQTVDFSNSGARIISGSFDRSIIIWNAETASIDARLIGHSDEITSVAFSPDDTTIVSTSCAERDLERTCIRGEVLLWNAITEREIRELVGHADIVNAGEFTHDGNQIVTVGCSTRREGRCIAGETLIWDVAASNDLIQQLNGHNSSVFSVDYDADNARLLSGGGSLLLEDQPQGDTRIILWDTNTGTILNRYDAHTGNVTELLFHPNGAEFISSSRDTTVRIWSFDNTEELRRFEGHSGNVYDIELTSDAQSVLSAGDNRVLLWNYETLEIALTLENFGNQISARSLAISPDDKTFVTGLNNGVIILWDIATGEEIRRLAGHTDDVITLEFSADGQFLFSGSNDRRIRLWDIATGETIRIYNGHIAPVSDVTVTADNHYLLSASEDNTLRYWDIASGELIREFRGHTGQIFDASLSDNGSIAYTASADGSVIGWRISVDAVMAWLSENRYQRTLTPEELSSYELSFSD